MHLPWILLAAANENRHRLYLERGKTGNEKDSYPVQYSGIENLNEEAWWKLGKDSSHTFRTRHRSFRVSILYYYVKLGITRREDGEKAEFTLW